MSPELWFLLCSAGVLAGQLMLHLGQRSLYREIRNWRLSLGKDLGVEFGKIENREKSRDEADELRHVQLRQDLRLKKR